MLLLLDNGEGSKVWSGHLTSNRPDHWQNYLSSPVFSRQVEENATNGMDESFVFITISAIWLERWDLYLRHYGAYHRAILKCPTIFAGSEGSTWMLASS